jgi:predicted ATPase
MTNGQNDHRLYPSQKLAAKIAAKTLHADPAQAAIAIRLDQLIDRLPTAALSRRKWPMVISPDFGQDFGQPIQPDFACLRKRQSKGCISMAGLAAAKPC